jgi:hypothetical protein
LNHLLAEQTNMDRYFMRDILIFLTYAGAVWWGIQIERASHEMRPAITSTTTQCYVPPPYESPPPEYQTGEESGTTPKKIVDGTTYPHESFQGDDSCQYANDGSCDERRWSGSRTLDCRDGTDHTDCSLYSSKPCQYSDDGKCDEGTFCLMGTDTNDCLKYPNRRLMTP